MSTALIRSLLDVPILYGGSVKPDNAASLLGEPDVAGALVGGASLDTDSFTEICLSASIIPRSARRSRRLGLAAPGPGNAVELAATPVFDALLERFPHSQLDASGEAVGLPDGQMGNSRSVTSRSAPGGSSTRI